MGSAKAHDRTRDRENLIVALFPKDRYHQPACWKFTCTRRMYDQLSLMLELADTLRYLRLTTSHAVDKPFDICMRLTASIVTAYSHSRPLQRFRISNHKRTTSGKPASFIRTSLQSTASQGLSRQIDTQVLQHTQDHLDFAPQELGFTSIGLPRPLVKAANQRWASIWSAHPLEPQLLL